MKEEGGRREFLQRLSLAGAALIAGGGALATAGCAKTKKGESPSPVDETCAGGHKKICAWIDENGRLYIKDEDLRTQLNQKMQALADAGKPNSGDRLGIAVSWDDPGSEGNKMNSLCTC